jgi:hypothetical protein
MHRLRPLLRLPFGRLILFTPDRGEALLAGGLVFGSHLSATVFRAGRAREFLDLGSGVVTTAGVNYLTADMAGGANDISAFTWHGTGIGATAAVIGDTALGNTTGAPARVSGTQTTPGTVNIFQSVATIAYTGTLAITEWGLFSAVTAGTMWDRRVFTAINVNNLDSIQFTYQLTTAAGG